MNDIEVQVAALRTEVRYLKWIIPVTCGLVALLVLIFFGIQHAKIGERVEMALQEEGVQNALRIARKAMKTTETSAKHARIKAEEAASDATKIATLKDQASRDLANIARSSMLPLLNV